MVRKKVDFLKSQGYIIRTAMKGPRSVYLVSIPDGLVEGLFRPAGDGRFYVELSADEPGRVLLSQPEDDAYLQAILDMDTDEYEAMVRNYLLQRSFHK